MLPELIVWGAGGHARVVADIVRCAERYAIKGFIDDVHPERAGEVFDGAPLLGGREALTEHRGAHVIVAFGNCAARLEAAEFAVRRGLRLAKAIHPRAVVASSARIGPGVVIAANAVVSPGAVIGGNVIINTAASVDHDCTIGESAHLCPGARLAGNVNVGELSWIGIGATVIDGVTIGRNTIIGAGAVVVENIGDGVVAYGVPARVVRRNE